MVSNYDRILDEITVEATRIGLDNDLPPEPLIELVMEIVDAEDRNRIKPFSVNKDVESLIRQTATKFLRS